jgi:uncharacterized protein (DUF1501 family)
MTQPSRRQFLKTAGALGALGAIGGANAAASTPSGYQALVCIFLAGGNDGHNAVVPIQTAKQSYSLYAQGRGGLALPQSSLLPIANNGDQYGLHPLMPEMQALYNGGNAAIIANVGMLVKPITRAMYLANSLANVPVQLFSHGDQVNAWQSAVPDGTATTGWGGLVEDNLQTYNSGAAFSPITSTSGCGLFCNGQQTYPATVPVGGASLLIGATTSNRLQAVRHRHG